MSGDKDRNINNPVDATSAGEPFIERWSRRKTALRDRVDNGPASESPAAQSAPVEAPDEAEQQPILTDADMLPIESLDGDSDYAPFMSPGVSEQLRNQALRKLFHLPAFNVTDGLNDYDEDFTRFTSLGDTVTHEMKRVLQRELEAAGKSVDASAPVVTDDLLDETAVEDVENVQDTEDGSEETV